MSDYTGSIFVKHPEYKYKRTYEKEFGKLYNIETDPDVQKDIARLEELSTFVRRSAHRCEMTEEFLEKMYVIGGINEKYAEIMSLNKDSVTHNRFRSAIKKASDARRVFVHDCECKYKRKLY